MATKNCPTEGRSFTKVKNCLLEGIPSIVQFKIYMLEGGA